MLGRDLRSKEVVHHEDEDKTNNKWDNLYVFKNQSNHVRYHHTGIKEKEEDYWVAPPQLGTPKNPYIKQCEICKEEFKTVTEQRFCSQECVHEYNRIERPSKEVLYEEVKEKPFTKVAEVFNVSDTTIRNWCKYYGIPSKSKYYR